jgi:hypothetical protein
MLFNSIDEDPRTSTSEFTNLGLLLRLLALLNSNKGSPTLNGTLSRGPGVEQRDTSLSPLEGAAAILVQEFEVIATTYSSTGKMMLATSELEADGGAGAGADGAGADARAGAGTGPGTDLDVQAADPSTTGADSGKSFNMQFAVVPNPDQNTNAQNVGKDGSSRPKNPHNLRVLNPGSDLSGVIKRYEWAYALK